MNKKALLILGLVLVGIGLIKPDLTTILNNKPSVIDSVVVVTPPSDQALVDAAQKVIDIMKKAGSSRVSDSRRLSSLYCDMARLIELDGEDLVIKNTEEIKQANSLSGLMLRLDLKGKYPELASAAKAVIIAGIGDDAVTLDPKLRAKAAESFMALAWAFNESSK